MSSPSPETRVVSRRQSLPPSLSLSLTTLAGTWYDVVVRRHPRPTVPWTRNNADNGGEEEEEEGGAGGVEACTMLRSAAETNVSQPDTTWCARRDILCVYLCKRVEEGGVGYLLRASGRHKYVWDMNGWACRGEAGRS